MSSRWIGAARSLAIVVVLAAGTTESAAQGAAGMLAPVRAARHRPIALGREVRDSLTSRDAVLPDQSHFHAWRFAARSGQEIVAKLTSADFGGFLMVVALAGDSLQLLSTESGTPGGTAAQIALTVPSAGDYLIVANTVNAASTGRYTLSLRSLADACATGGPCAIAGSRTSTQDPIAAASVAAGVRAIALGDAREGQITTADSRLRDGSYFHVWRYQGTAGQRVVMDLSSSDFDPYLTLAVQTADSVQQLRSNDDGPNGRDSQLAVELPQTATYLVVANTLRADQTGRYRLTLRSMAQACAAAGPCEPTDAASASPSRLAAAGRAQARNLTFGQSIEGRLIGGGPTIGDGTHFNAYRFEAAAGEEVAIFLSSSQFDTYLYLARRNGQRVDQLGSDDDSGGGRNSLITARLRDSGEYLVVANGLSSSDTGSYSLTLRRLRDACTSQGVCEIGASITRMTFDRAVLAAPARAIALGNHVSGQLSDAAPTLPEGKPFESWRYSGRAGERLVITQRSSDFDSYLYLLRADGSSVHEIARNDDDAGNRDAEITVALDRDGEYRILASGFGASARGAYQLSVQSLASACIGGGPCALGESSAGIARLQPAFAAEQRPLALEQVVTATLTTDAPIITTRGRFHAFRFRGDANQRVVLTLDSDAFDPYLYLTRVAGGRLRLVATDDDGGQGTNARLVATLSEAGEYVVIAAAFRVSGLGSYRMALRRCDDACAAETATTETATTAVAGGSRGLYTAVLGARRLSLPSDGIVESALAATDPTLTDGSHFHAYWFEAREGTAVRAAMSATFDAYLVLLRLDGDSLMRIVSNDDGGEGTNALLEWTADRSGTYVIVANSYSRAQTGPYTLRVELGGGSAPPLQPRVSRPH